MTVGGIFLEEMSEIPFVLGGFLNEILDDCINIVTNLLNTPPLQDIQRTSFLDINRAIMCSTSAKSMYSEVTHVPIN